MLNVRWVTPAKLGTDTRRSRRRQTPGDVEPRTAQALGMRALDWVANV